MVVEPEPAPYARTSQPKAPKLDRFKPIIDAVLETDPQAPRK